MQAYVEEAGKTVSGCEINNVSVPVFVSWFAYFPIKLCTRVVNVAIALALLYTFVLVVLEHKVLVFDRRGLPWVRWQGEEVHCSMP